MRPRFRTTGTEELQEVCSRLRVFARHQACERPAVKRARWGDLGPLAFVAAILLGIVMLLGGGNFLADTAIKALRDAERQRTELWWKEEFARRASRVLRFSREPGGWYLIEWEGRPLRIHFKGTLHSLRQLPTTSNELGDFYSVEDQEHIWVWMIPGEGSVPSWVDP